ncbi:MAG: dUTP diphosphatase [Oscillospiraceae bacterium]|nr:dUTP diphosphatase [Oscillospiraceae bacterium]
MKEMKIKLLTDTASVPMRATEGSAGYDLRADIKEAHVLKKGEIFAVPTGIAIALPDKNYVAVVCARSGLAIKHGISLANGVGIIDSDYRGEIKVGLINLGNEDFVIEPNERIAQMLIMPVETPELTPSEEIEKTERGDGGFGSTGRK